jgi:hypothetical protein
VVNVAIIPPLVLLAAAILWFYWCRRPAHALGQGRSNRLRRPGDSRIFRPLFLRPPLPSVRPFPDKEWMRGT